jgi:glycosyltransferase involved in cell wall biosynthesis
MPAVMSGSFVVADYQASPSEGIQVVSKTLIDGMRERGRTVVVVPPQHLGVWLPKLIALRPKLIVFVHGPGDGVVRISAILRKLTRARIIWIATRPDLGEVPRWATGRRTAHAVVCNRRRPDLNAVAADAQMVEQFIGIDPSRLRSSAGSSDPWPELRRLGRPIALHVGHLRRNRGLDLLVEAKDILDDRIEIVVQGSPAFDADPEVVEELKQVGVHVRRAYVPNLADLYQAAHIYLFPGRHEDAGAVELPLGVLEAVACRRPVLANDFGAIRPALDGIDGVQITTPERFVADLKSILDNPDGLQIAPAGLPRRLHAERVTDAVLSLAGA